MAFLAEMTALCEALHCLPREGGLLDQDSYHVYGMSLVLQAQAERREKDRGRKHA